MGVVSSLSTVSSWCAEQADESGDVREKVAVIQTVVTARREAVEELLAGEVTYPETVNRFRALALVDPLDIVGALDQLFPGHSEDELYYLHVLLYAKSATRMRRGGHERLNSLKEEFEQRRQSGTLHATSSHVGG
jgi:hypothetical protein